jgi:3-hydroxybutyryl-CoA dehydrogenase
MASKSNISVIGAGTMGAGIAQLAAQQGHEVSLFDLSGESLERALTSIKRNLSRLKAKGKLSDVQYETTIKRIKLGRELSSAKGANFVIEAVSEELEVKQNLFRKLEDIVSDSAILATNTSALSVTAVSAACKHRSRVIGAHFFNPAPVMPLVEIVKGVLTSEETVANTRALLNGWSKTCVLAKDTPAFIVNRVARPFYGEALRIYEEGLADFVDIDYAMKELGGFRMGPFELMDFIGNDINFQVTETVFKAFYYDPRFKPSFTQKRMVEAGLLGRKSAKGYYDYSDGAQNPEPRIDKKTAEEIFYRILVMLINEAADVVFLKVASIEDTDMAMIKGVNYPKGLLKWADEIGISEVLSRLNFLYEEYGEDRYRPNPLLRRMVKTHANFYS